MVSTAYKFTTRPIEVRYSNTKTQQLKEWVKRKPNESHLNKGTSIPS